MKHSQSQKRHISIYALALTVLLQSCASVKEPHVVDANNEQLKQTATAKNYFIADSVIPPIVEQEISAASETQEALFSVSLKSVPVGEFLQALAQDAEIDLLLNNGLEGLLSIQMQNKPLTDILAEVARQLPLRYELSNKVLQVFPDEAYLKTYPVDYLNVNRTASSDIDLSTQIGSISLDSESGGSGGNNSRTSVANLSVNEFWQSLEANLRAIAQQEDPSTEGTIIINREAGFVTVRAKHDMQNLIASYIDKVVLSAQRQVLIEALVIELVLKDQFQAGVDWRVLTQNGESGNYVQNFSGGPSVTAANIQNISAPQAIFSIFTNSSSGNSISATMSLLREFGEANILSSPKINALNNQSAVLKVVDNRVYFALDVKKVTEDDVETLTTTSEIKTVPIGLVMNVLPFISQDNDIILNIRPTISRILGYASDPNPDLASAGIQNLVPEIQVREMESVLRVQSGGLVVIGGLMQDQISESEVSVPGLSLLPGVGNLFRYKSKTTSKTELLVLLRPTVIENEHAYNKRLDRYLK